MSKQIAQMIDIVADDLDELIQSVKSARNFTADYMLLALNKSIIHLQEQKSNDYALAILNMEDKINQLTNKESDNVSSDDGA